MNVHMIFPCRTILYNNNQSFCYTPKKYARAIVACCVHAHACSNVRLRVYTWYMMMMHESVPNERSKAKFHSRLLKYNLIRNPLISSSLSLSLSLAHPLRAFLLLFRNNLENFVCLSAECTPAPDPGVEHYNAFCSLSHPRTFFLSLSLPPRIAKLQHI